jgi:phosphoribosyl 1,2-cyclic phosphodiesterase
METGISSVSAPATPLLKARCWGTRGSLPSPGRDTVRYGGNTSCLEVSGVNGHRLIFDAGSGIRPLGEDMSRSQDAVTADLFLTHFHWDHIQGLPFFGPMYDPSTGICVHGAQQGDLDLPKLVAGTMGPIYFPVPFEAVSAHMRFRHIDGDVVERDGVVISAHRVRHPTHAYGFRIDAPGASIAYVPDNEIFGAQYDTGPGWYDSFCSFLRGVDVLFHDAMFTDAEYPRFEGWGHSSVPQAIRLAEDAGVRHLNLFHHSPGRTDFELDRIVSDARDDLGRRGSSLSLGVATEGEELVVEERK